jgi:hypothetical protein
MISQAPAKSIEARHLIVGRERYLLRLAGEIQTNQVYHAQVAFVGLDTCDVSPVEMPHLSAFGEQRHARPGHGQTQFLAATTKKPSPEFAKSLEHVPSSESGGDSPVGRRARSGAV